MNYPDSEVNTSLAVADSSYRDGQLTHHLKVLACAVRTLRREVKSLRATVEENQYQCGWDGAAQVYQAELTKLQAELNLARAGSLHERV
jgi:hypothetical protein